MHGRGAALGRGGAARCREVFPLEPLQPNASGETAERWRYVDGGGEIGVISSVTQAFCRDCNRARLSTEGKLFLCLFASRGHDLRALLRGGYSDEQIAAAIGLIWSEREDRYSELRGAGTRRGRQRRAPRRDALHRRVRRLNVPRVTPRTPGRAGERSGSSSQSATACASSGVTISPGTFRRASSV